MGFLEKILAIIMLPISVLVVLEATEIFSIGLPFDKLLIGAGLMIVLQIMTLLFLKLHGGELRPINLIIAAVLIFPAGAYLVSYFLAFNISYLPIILGIVMFVEALYAFH